MTVRAKVRFWRLESGWGVVDAPQVPGGCYVNFTSLRMDGFRALTEASWVNLDFEPSEDETFPYVALSAWPEGSDPYDPTAPELANEGPYSSELTLSYDNLNFPGDSRTT